MGRQSTKWIIGLTSVALYTGLLYTEGVMDKGRQANATTHLSGASVGQQDQSTDFSNDGGQDDSLSSQLDWSQQELTIPQRDDTGMNRRSGLRTRRS